MQTDVLRSDGQHKKAEFRDSKAAGDKIRSQRLCLRPPYVPFSWTAIVGYRTGGEVLVVRFLHLPSPDFRSAKGGDAQPDH